MGKTQDWTIIERLGDVILQHTEGCVFEIGIGKSTLILKELANRNNRELYCFEISRRKCEWAKGIGCRTCLGKTRVTLDLFSDIPIAMGLIDGRHDSATVRFEANFFLKRLTPGGMIFLHDTYMQSDAKIRDESHPRGASGEVYIVRQELELRKDLQVFTWPYTAMNQGLTMVLKMEENRPYCRA